MQVSAGPCYALRMRFYRSGKAVKLGTASRAVEVGRATNNQLQKAFVFNVLTEAMGLMSEAASQATTMIYRCPFEGVQRHGLVFAPSCQR
jgi:hypothetical protein